MARVTDRSVSDLAADVRDALAWRENLTGAEAALDELVTRLEAAEAESAAAWIGSQIALCEEFIRAAKNDETFGVEDIEAKLILLTQAER